MYLWKCSIVPEIAFVREAIADVAELPLLNVLLDGVQRLFLGDLEEHVNSNPRLGVWAFVKSLAYLHLSIGPSWNLDNHIQDCLLLIGV